MTTLPDCSICCEPLAFNLGSLKCGHVFHSECILQWLAEKQLCPLCKQTVHRSHIRNLFFSASSSSNSNGSQAISVSLVGSDSNNEALVERLRAESRECRLKLSECTDQLRQKDVIISELNRKNRALELDQERHIADIHTSKIKLETLKQSSCDQAAGLQNHIKKLERQVAQLRNEQKIKSSIEQQNRDGNCDISAIKKQCKAMAPDMKLKFLLSQLEFTSDLYSQLQKRSKTLEKELSQARQQNSALQALDPSLQRNTDVELVTKCHSSAESEEIIVLDDADDEDGYCPERYSAKSKVFQNHKANERNVDKNVETISSTRTSSLYLPASRNEQSISVTLEKPSTAKKAAPKGVLCGFSLGSNPANVSCLSGRGSTGTGGTSSTFSLIQSHLLKDRFRSNTKILSSAKTQDIRNVLKRSHTEMRRF